MNYKCPKCKGEFNKPVSKWSDIMYIYYCPFCNEIMEGLTRS